MQHDFVAIFGDVRGHLSQSLQSCVNISEHMFSRDLFIGCEVECVAPWNHWNPVNDPNQVCLFPAPLNPHPVTVCLIFRKPVHHLASPVLLTGKSVELSHHCILQLCDWASTLKPKTVCRKYDICQCILVNMSDFLAAESVDWVRFILWKSISLPNSTLPEIAPRSPLDLRLKQGVRELCRGFLSTQPRHKYEEMINQQTNKHGRCGRVMSKFNLNQRPLVNPCLGASWNMCMTWWRELHGVVSCQRWSDIIEISLAK